MKGHCLTCLFLLILMPLQGQSLFLSDGLGHELVPLEVLSGSEAWYLAVIKKEGREIRTLFKDQSELKRWEIIRREEERLSLIENYYYKNRLREIREFDREGFLLSEQMYDNEGGLLEYRQYLLDESGRPSRIITLDEQGAQEISYRLLYRENGSLRGISGEKAEVGIETRILWRSDDPEKFFDRIYLEERGIAYRYDYDEGQLQLRLIFREGTETVKTVYTSNPAGKAEKETSWDHRDKSMTVFYFDDEGRTVLENHFLKGILKKSLTRIYEGERMMRLLERSDTEKLLWEYEYRNENSDPSVSRLYRNDSLIKTVFHDESPVREVIYKNDEAVYEKLLDRESEGGGS